MKEWYLIGNNTSPNMIGGFENQSFVDCKSDAFLETLTTDIADTVILYNYDLSESQEIRGIIQDNVADTSLKSMERDILVPIGTLRSGDYIYFEDEYWIVDGRPGNNKIYEKAVLKECQYKLRWQKDDGSIIERWANFASASKYDVGTTGNNVILLNSNNYTIITPNDKDSLTLEGKRVFIDISDNPIKVFNITRNDDVLFRHGSHGGTLNFIADRTEFNPNADNQELKLCDYIVPTTSPSSENNETIVLNAVISGNTNLKIGFKRTYTAIFTSDDNTEIDLNNINFTWNIASDFADKISFETQDNFIKLYVDDEELIDEKFKLQLLIDDIVNNEIVISISDAL